ncbi:MAG: DNA-binding protein [Zestosphaera tikiterensis]|uniref:Transcription elongation factor Spt4 n=1 Tax=Zestosphaera tikiterensis TaxID=1973259 RepID=A0A2R7Y7G4_9CREN|nr:MAG: DNA-binding protein [Zestosphaera tikiterensis]
MPARRERKPPFKACTNCRFLVSHETVKCPNCGSTSFTDEWSGMIILVNPNHSEVALLLEIKSKEGGKFAIRLGT